MDIKDAISDDTRRMLSNLSRLREGGTPAATGVPLPIWAPRHDAGRAGTQVPLWVALALALAALAAMGGSAWWVHTHSVVPAPAPAATLSVQPKSAGSGSVLEASGFVVANRQATVSAAFTGRIVRLHVEEGSFVRRGQTIAELDSSVSSAQVAYAQAGVQAAERAAAVTRTKIMMAKRNLLRSEDLAARGFVSQASLDQTTESVESLQAQITSDQSQVEVAVKQLSLQREQLRSLNVVAPFDGIVTELSAHVGEIVSPVSGGGGFTRTGICTIVDPASLEGEVDVNEQHLGRLRQGQRVAVRLPAYPELTLNGRIATLPTAVNRSTAAVKLRIAFDEPSAQLRPGMRADFGFMASSITSAASAGQAAAR